MDLTLHKQPENRQLDLRSVAIAQSKPMPPELDILKLVEASLDDDKAENTVVVDLAGKTAMADYMVVTSGTSKRHVSAMAEHIQRQLRAKGLKSIPVEGLVQCDWVLIDAGDVIVHLFRPEVREFYNLEKLWTLPTRREAGDETGNNTAGATA